MHTSINTFNGLNGKTVSRKKLETVLLLAKKEGIQEIVQRVQKVLNQNNDLFFEITIKEPVKEVIGLGTPDKKYFITKKKIKAFAKTLSQEDYSNKKKWQLLESFILDHDNAERNEDDIFIYIPTQSAWFSLYSIIDSFYFLDNKKNGLNASVNKNINTSTDAFKSMSVRELRNYTLKYYNEHLRGKSVEIEKHLKEVVFTNTAGKKIAKGEAMYSEKATIIEYLEELIKKSSYNNWGQRKSTDNSEVLGYLNFKSKITIDNVKRHVRISLIVYKNRKSELKNVEVGKIKKSGKHNAELQCSTLQDDVCKPLSNHKDNKKHTKKPILKEKKDTDTLNKPVPITSVAYKMQKNHDRIREYYEISDPELAKYLGKIEKKTKESVAITIAGEQGSSKTRLAFQLMKAFGTYKIGHASIEEHPDSELYEEKLREYVPTKVWQNLTAPEINTIEDVHKLVKENDIIIIDSFTKLQEMQRNIGLDKDFRKAYDGKLFIIIYQLTGGKTMRGGTKSQYDGDIIIFLKKDRDYKKNYAFFDKNRYTKKNLEDLKYSVFHKKILKPDKEVKLKFKVK